MRLWARYAALATFLFAAGFLASCDTIVEPFDFDVRGDLSYELTLTSGGTTSGNPQSGDRIDIGAEVRANGFTLADVTSVTVSSATLNLDEVTGTLPTLLQSASVKVGTTTMANASALSGTSASLTTTGANVVSTVQSNGGFLSPTLEVVARSGQSGAKNFLVQYRIVVVVQG